MGKSRRIIKEGVKDKGQKRKWGNKKVSGRNGRDKKENRDTKTRKDE